MKVWVKVALLNSMILLFLAFLIALAMKSVVIDAVQGQSMQTQESIVRTIADRIANYILLGDHYKTNQALRDIKKNERDIQYIFVTDLKGQLFAHTFINGHPPGLLTWNPLAGLSQSVQLLDTEKGYISDIGVSVFDGLPAEVHVGIKGNGIKRSLARIRNIVIVLTAIVTLLGTAASILFSRVLTSPLQNVVQFTEALSRGEFGKTLPASSPDEIGQLVETFNSLSQELRINRDKMKESYRQMYMTEKISSMARLSAGLAHELRNPLTAIKILLNTVKDSSELTAKDKEVILTEISYMDGILSRFLNSAHSDNPTISTVDVNHVIEEAIALIKIQAKKQVVKIKFKPEPLPLVMANQSMLEQALLNLFINAVEAMPQGGDLSVRAATNEGWLGIIIQDTGGGIASEVQENVFEPFVTTKPEGTGLGLFIVENIISSHHGKLSFANDGQGTTFTIKLPLQQEVPANG